MDGVGRVIVDADAAEPASGRDGQRASFFLSARLRLADSPTVHEGRVRNLSPGGMMIELDRVVEPGLGVTLEMRGLGELTGQIAWCTDGRIGGARAPADGPRQGGQPGGGGPRPSGAEPPGRARLEPRQLLL